MFFFAMAIPITETLAGQIIVDADLTVNSNALMKQTLTIEGAIVSNTLTMGAGATIDMSSNRIVNVAPPTDPEDAANKEYVDEYWGPGRDRGQTTWSTNNSDPSEHHEPGRF